MEKRLNLFPGLRRLKVRWSNGDGDEVMNDESPFKPGLRIKKNHRIDSVEWTVISEDPPTEGLFFVERHFFEMLKNNSIQKTFVSKQQGSNMPNTTRTGKIINLIQNML